MKPENIMFVNDEDEDVKIIDFGLGKKYCTNKQLNSIVGTPYYVAPEIFS